MAHRKAIRVTVGTSDVDVPLGVFSTGQFAKYDGTQFLGANNVTIGPGSSVSGNIASFNGTSGALLQDSGVSATAHAARHLPGGADTVFAGTYVAGDDTRWNGAAFDPKSTLVNELSTSPTVTSTTLQNINTMSIALPRAGTYWVEGMLMCVATATLTSAFGMSVPSTLTRMNIGWMNVLTGISIQVGAQSASLAVGGAGVAAGSRVLTASLPVYFAGSITISGGTTVQLLASVSTSTLTFNPGSSWIAEQK